MSDPTRFECFDLPTSVVLRLEELLEEHGAEQLLVALKVLCDHHGIEAYNSRAASTCGVHIVEWNRWSRATRAALAVLDPATAPSAP